MLSTAPSISAPPAHPPDIPLSLPSRMQAVIQRAYGSSDVFGFDEVAVPSPGEREVLVQVHAAGLDRGTWHIMTGEPLVARLALGLRRPKQPVPGLDLSGEVVATGPGVTGFAVGDEVFGIGQGSYAGYAVAGVDKLARKPATLSFVEAAAVPVSGLTAIQAVLDAGQLQAGQRVLILGASGGVGSFATQIAHSTGAHVTAVASTAKLDLVRSLGADVVLDYTHDDVLAGEPYDLIVDIGGHRSLGSLRRALTRNGTLVIVGAEGGGKVLGIGRQVRAVALSPFVSQTLKMLISSENASDLDRLANLIEDGQLAPVVERTWPLAEVADAMRHLEAGRARGKLVLLPGAD